MAATAIAGTRYGSEARLIRLVSPSARPPIPPSIISGVSAVAARDGSARHLAARAAFTPGPADGVLTTCIGPVPSGPVPGVVSPIGGRGLVWAGWPTSARLASGRPAPALCKSTAVPATAAGSAAARNWRPTVSASMTRHRPPKSRT